MAVVQMIFYTLIVLGVLITFHEFGHFWVARRCGIKVLRFSIGFGPALLRWRDKLGTEFVIAALPLGGYVKMVDEREGPVAPEDVSGAFNRKPVTARIATVAAGPLANFVLALIAYWLVFMLGTQGVAPIVNEVVPGSVAASAGLEPGQEIVAVDGVETPTWQALGEQLVRRIGDTGPIRFSVIYPDSPLRYDSEGLLEQWDVDTDSPDPIGSIGLKLYQPLVIPVADEVTTGDPADIAGMVSGDLIVAADGVAMSDWHTWVEYVRERPGQAIDVTVERGGQTFITTVTPKRVAAEGGGEIGQVGMSVVVPQWPEDLFREMKYGPVEAMVRAGQQTWKTSALILSSIKKMITGDISVKHLSGPITIAKVAGASAQYGLGPFLQFMALLSVSLGVLNLLPIPVLDGGHLAYYLVEAVKGRPVSDKVQEFGYRIGLMLVVGLMVLALYNDLLRL